MTRYVPVVLATVAVTVLSLLPACREPPVGGPAHGAATKDPTTAVATTEPEQPAAHVGAAASASPAPQAPASSCNPPTTIAVARDASTAQTAEQIALRLDELTAAPCVAGLDARELAQIVSKIGTTEHALEGLWVDRHDEEPRLVLVGGDAWLGLYERASSRFRLRIFVDESGSPPLDPSLDPAFFPDPRALHTLDARATRAPDGQPLLVLANTHPWVASCWRDLRFAVFAPGPRPSEPVSKYTDFLSGRWCEGVTIEVSTPGISFDYLSWTRSRSLSPGNVWRAYRTRLAWQGDRLQKRFGFVKNDPESVVEDWLALPWTLALEATQPTERASLAHVHAASRARPPSDQDVHETETVADSAGARTLRITCHATSPPDQTKPCAAWPTPVEFELVRDATGRWLVAEVRRTAARAVRAP